MTNGGICERSVCMLVYLWLMKKGTNGHNVAFVDGEKKALRKKLLSFIWQGKKTRE